MYYYIINPTAGGGTIAGLQDKLRAQIRAHGIDGEFAKSTSEDDATRLAQQAVAKGYTTIVAVGGDGTLNEVINGVDDKVAVGIIPIGHTNAVATHLGITSWQHACQALAERRLSEYRLIAAGKQYFLSTLNLGFETELDKQHESPASSRRAQIGRFKTSWQHAQRFDTLACAIKTEAFELEAEAFSLSVANQKFLSPQADNRLAITLSERPGHRARTSYVWQLLRGFSPLEEAASTRFLADRALIETKPATGITIDGKLAGRTPIAIRLTDRTVRLIVAKAAA